VTSAIPGWPTLPLSRLGAQVTSGSRGWAKYYAKHGDLFVRITNLTREHIWLDLNDCRYIRVDSSDAEAVRTQLAAGDLLVSITADIGIIGYVDETVPTPAYINQHIARVRLDPTLADGRFVAHYLASWAPQRRFVGVTDTGAKAGMNLTTVAGLQTLVPPVEEQRVIADALGDADALVEALKRMLTKKQALKQGIAQELLTARKRLRGFSGSWQSRRLSALLSYEQPTPYLVSNTDYVGSGTPVLTAGKTFVLGHTDDKHGIYRAVPAIIFDDFTTASKLVTFPFKAKSSAMKMLRARPGTNLRFVYERMQLINFQAVDHKRRWISEYSKLEVSVPDEAEQTAIADVLADADAEIGLLRQRLAKAKAIKEGMAQQLLTGRVRLPNPEPVA
jgi:type I restriction enzyme S subunit